MSKLEGPAWPVFTGTGILKGSSLSGFDGWSCCAGNRRKLEENDLTELEELDVSTRGEASAGMHARTKYIPLESSQANQSRRLQAGDMSRARAVLSRKCNV